MGRIVPLGSIPKSNVVPDGLYRLKVEKFEEGTTKEGDGRAAKLQYKLTARIIEPEAYKGLFYFDQFCIGTEEDPDAEELSTWQTSFGSRNMGKFLDKVGVPFGDEEDAENLCNAVKGQEYLATVVQKTEPNTRKDRDGNEYDNPYKGQVRNNVTAYWALGEKTPGLLESNQPAKVAKKTTAKAPAGQPAKPAPSDDVSCSACKKRVPRKELKAHVDAHMKEFAENQGGGSDDSDE